MLRRPRSSGMLLTTIISMIVLITMRAIPTKTHTGVKVKVRSQSLKSSMSEKKSMSQKLSLKIRSNRRTLSTNRNWTISSKWIRISTSIMSMQSIERVLRRSFQGSSSMPWICETLSHPSQSRRRRMKSRWFPRRSHSRTRQGSSESCSHNCSGREARRDISSGRKRRKLGARSKNKLRCRSKHTNSLCRKRTRKLK